jgi:hypothetical protein
VRIASIRAGSTASRAVPIHASSARAVNPASRSRAPTDARFWLGATLLSTTAARR